MTVSVDFGDLCEGALINQRGRPPNDGDRTMKVGQDEGHEHLASLDIQQNESMVDCKKGNDNPRTLASQPWCKYQTAEATSFKTLTLSSQLNIKSENPLIGAPILHVTIGQYQAPFIVPTPTYQSHQIPMFQSS
ncbi:hypothetical protein V6N11_082944 [Hibiscus sabdariffa]|uniref:Uncharacterized protein n=1 Tax=Hibiscus sabdariffa TaxID=183260 RepID=A0ABR2QKE4_9ROSI